MKNANEEDRESARTGAMTSPIGRRRFMTGAAMLAASGAAVAACGGGKPTASGQTSQSGGPTGSASSAPGGSNGIAASTASSTSGGAKPPTLVPFTGVIPDLPAGAHGVPAGYYHYPANPPQFLPGPFGNGGTVTMFLQSTGISVPEAKNHWWQALNKALNVDINYQIASFTEYNQKFAVQVAGGDLPDIAQIIPVNGLQQVLEKEFTDLTDYLSGDAIKEYPGLASIPTASWQIPTINGRIWGIPQARSAAGMILSFRGDLLDKYGVPLEDTAWGPTPSVHSGQDFLDLCKELTDAKHNRWAMGAGPTVWALPGVLEMMEAPNVWAEKDGQFTSVNQSPQMKEALDMVGQIWKKGYLHPDSFATPAKNLTWFTGGITSLYFQSISGWKGFDVQYPSWKTGVIRAPKWGGGGFAAKALAVAGYVGGFPGLKKASPSRVKELLRIIDYLAAPFGCKEYLLANYGVEGVDYTLKGSDPVTTSAYSSEAMPIYYVATQGNVAVYAPTDPDLVKHEHAYLAAVLPTGMTNPAQGLYSETALGAGVAADAALQAVQADIIQGRRKVSDWDAAVKTWLQQAGNAEAKEYSEAYAAAH
jgi:putative aldouronate transport system substrate-binding protein